MTKFCKKCSTEKPLSEFAKCASYASGRQNKCKACSNAQSKIWSAKNRDKRAAYDAKRYPATRERTSQRSAVRRTNAKTRARQLVLAAKLRMPEGFSLTIERVTERIENGICAVTGIPFDLRPFEAKRSGKRCNPFAPSIDRIDSNQGYTDENTRVVVWQFNHMKGELTDVELLEVCRRIVASNL